MVNTDRIRIEYVVFNKLYKIITASPKPSNGLLLVGPRSVGKSYVLTRLKFTFLLRDRDIVSKCLNEISTFECNNEESTGNECKRVAELIKCYNVIPIFHDCMNDKNLSLDIINKYANSMLSGLDYTDQFIILLLVDNVHYCYGEVGRILDSIFTRKHVVVVAASPTAYIPSELKHRGLETIRFYPLRFGEISIELINKLKTSKGNSLPLKGEERRRLITNVNYLIDHMVKLSKNYLVNKLYSKLVVLFSLYSVFGGTMFGFDTLKMHFEKLFNYHGEICNSENGEDLLMKILGRRLEAYVGALKRTYDAIIDDAIRVSEIDNIYKPYVEATFHVLAKSLFEEINITFSNIDIKNKAIEIGNSIALGHISNRESQKIVQRVLEYLRDADILFQVRAYRPNTRIAKTKNSVNKSVTKHKYVYSDPRYLYAAYYSYLLHTPYDSTRDPASLVKEKLKEILLSMLCIEINSDQNNEELIGALLEMITLQNIMLNLYGIRASADKPRDPQPAGYGLYTYRLEVDKKNEESDSECSQFELDALVVKNNMPLYGIEVSRSEKRVDELKCAIRLAKDIGFNTVFNVYLRPSYNKKIVREEKFDGVRIVYVSIPVFLLATT